MKKQLQFERGKRCKKLKMIQQNKYEEMITELTQ